MVYANIHMEVKTLTIFTPAYNRAHTLVRTYESLLNQSCKDFEWLVIDDGSSDNTREIVESWIADNKIPIRYIYQKNQGMHGAHNTAYRNIRTELNTCIDSDDYMPAEAVERIVTFWNSITDDKKHKIAGIIGLDEDKAGNIIGKRFKDDLKETTLTDYYNSGGRGDKKLVYRTTVIKGYPEYPLFSGERYIGLAYKYMLIDRDYTMLTLNQPLVTVEYQLDGSSFNMYKQYWNNPKGFSFFRRAEMICNPSLKRRFVSCVHYVATSLISKNKKFFKESPKKIYTFFALLPGYLWYLQIKHKVEMGAKMNFL